MIVNENCIHEVFIEPTDPLILSEFLEEGKVYDACAIDEFPPDVGQFLYDNGVEFMEADCRFVVVKTVD